MKFQKTIVTIAPQRTLQSLERERALSNLGQPLEHENSGWIKDSFIHAGQPELSRIAE